MGLPLVRCLRTQVITACVIILAAASLVAARDVHAAAQRTFVASLGTDSNPCSLALPCRSFAAAAAQTNAGGEIIVVDSAGYGTVALTNSISIVAPPGVYAGITVSAGDGVSIAGSGLTVKIRGLTLSGPLTSIGVRAETTNSSIEVTDCVFGTFGNAVFVYGMGNYLAATRLTIAGAASGLHVAGGASAAITGVNIRESLFAAIEFIGGATLDVSDSTFSRNNVGIVVSAPDSLPVRADILRVAISGGDEGINLLASSPALLSATVDRVSVAGSANVGIGTRCLLGGSIKLSVTDSTISDIPSDLGAIRNNDAGCEVVAGRNTVVRSKVAFVNLAPGTFVSFGNNQLAQNTTDSVGTIGPGTLH